MINLESLVTPRSLQRYRLTTRRSLNPSHHIDDIGHPVEAKCHEMLDTSLLEDGDLPEDSGTSAILAAHIEDAIFSEFSFTDAKYKNRVRSRVANLRNKKNPALRKNLLVGSLTPKRLAKMSPEDPLRINILPSNH